MAITPASQAGDVGSIPIGRSNKSYPNRAETMGIEPEGRREYMERIPAGTPE